MEESKESTQPNKSEFIVDVVTAKQDINGVYVIPLRNEKDMAIPLNYFLGVITNNTGTWQSLGMAFNPKPGCSCMEITIFYMIPKESDFELHIKTFIDRLKEQLNDTTRDKKSN